MKSIPWLYKIFNNFLILLKIWDLKREFSDINDEMTAHYFLLIMRSERYHKGKLDIESEMKQYRRNKWKKKKEVAQRINNLRNQIK